jgi:hypothetical protein
MFGWIHLKFCLKTPPFILTRTENGEQTHKLTPISLTLPQGFLLLDEGIKISLMFLD